MKPDWKDAPEWANYLAMDRDGMWYWYQFEPVLVIDMWNAIGGNVQFATDTSYSATLEARPGAK